MRLVDTTEYSTTDYPHTDYTTTNYSYSLDPHYNRVSGSVSSGRNVSKNKPPHHSKIEWFENDSESSRKSFSLSLFRFWSTVFELKVRTCD